MAKVSKSVREKRKDFSKTKLKVGKTKQLPANHTDTSFKSKAVVLPKQSVNREATEKDARSLQHYTALLSHKSGDIRKDVLQQLTAHLVANPPSLSTTVTPLIKALAPLIIDDTSSVRKMLLELFQTVLCRLSRSTLNSHIDLLLLYISSAMTHISSGIRADSTKFLSWVLSNTNATEVIVTGQLAKFMDTFATLLGWAGQSTTLSNGRTTSKHLEVLENLLGAALLEIPEEVSPGVVYTVPLQAGEECFVPHRSTTVLLRPCVSLNLFAPETAQATADASNYTIIEPYLKHLLPYLSDKFTDSVNGDRTLCLPVLQTVRTLVSSEETRGRADLQAALKKIERGMDEILEKNEVGRGTITTQGLVGMWRTIQDELD